MKKNILELVFGITVGILMGFGGLFLLVKFAMQP